jgi:hypothetical protein
VAFRDWSNAQYYAFQQDAWDSIYNNIPSVPYLDENSDDQARELFEQGWLTFGVYSKEELDSIRQDFYDMVFLPEDMFGSLGFWQEYRELYSETDAA